MNTVENYVIKCSMIMSLMVWCTAVGKSALLARRSEDYFSGSYDQTIGIQATMNDVM